MQGERAPSLQATLPSKGVTRRVRGSQRTHPTELVAIKRQQKTGNLGSCPNSAFKAQVSLASTLQGSTPHQQVAPSPAFLLQASRLGRGISLGPDLFPRPLRPSHLNPHPHGHLHFLSCGAKRREIFQRAAGSWAPTENIGCTPCCLPAAQEAAEGPSHTS